MYCPLLIIAPWLYPLAPVPLVRRICLLCSSGADRAVDASGVSSQSAVAQRDVT